MVQLDFDSEKEHVCYNDVPVKSARRPKLRSAHKFVFATLALLILSTLVCGFAIETRILSLGPVLLLFGGNSSCSPSAVSLDNVKYHSEHEYYHRLREVTPLEPPAFQGDHAALCRNRIHLKQTRRTFSRCLPISGLTDPRICDGADRMDLLLQNSSVPICRASILHMLLVEVYEELQASGKSPIVMFGSLLGAVRDEGMIPFTEDADIGYSGRFQVGDNLQRLLWEKGYHLFLMTIWRVCVAPTHPLAAKLYDPSVPINTQFTVPYVDLYNMEQRRRTGEWKIEEMNKINGSRVVPDDKVRPFSKVTINGQQFDTVRDPNYLLERMYGEDYMTPKPRKGSIQQALDLRIGS